MKFGVHLPQIGAAATGEGLRDFAQLFEGLRFDSVWASDHIVLPRRVTSPYPYGRGGAFSLPPDLPFIEALSALTFVAGCTERVALGTSVLVLPIRNPVLTAKQLASLDVLSGGRLIAGVGAGWMEEEFAALDASFVARGRRLNEQLRLIRSLWTERDPVHDGEFYQVRDIGFAPKPLQQPHPPIWVGGHTPAALRRAARFGQAWHAIGLAPERLAGDHAIVCELARQCGRDGEVELTLRTGVRLDDASLTATIARLRAYRDAGVTHVVLEPAGMEDAATTARRLRKFCEVALPEIAG